MNIVLLGPQGSGKGTQARLLVDKFKFFYFENGQFLRKLAETNQNVKTIMASGGRVPDEEMSSYVSAYLDEQKVYDNILFDGFPRTLPQYNFLKNWLVDKQVSLDLGIFLTINEEETVRRLSARRQDLQTGKIYNLITDPPPVDIDQSKLIQREDDKPVAIKKRLSWYRELTLPLVNQLKKDIKVIEVDGTQEIEIIHSQISAILHNAQN